MKLVTTGIVAATVFLSAAPASASDTDLSPDGNRTECRRVVISMPDGSSVVQYRCDRD